MQINLKVKIKTEIDTDDIGLLLNELMKYSDFFVAKLKNEFFDITDTKTTISAESLKTSCINTLINIDSSSVSEDILSDEIEIYTNDFFLVEKMNEFNFSYKLKEASIVFLLK